MREDLIHLTEAQREAIFKAELIEVMDEVAEKVLAQSEQHRLRRLRRARVASTMSPRAGRGGVRRHKFAALKN
ncbi:hypothetical protein GCM10009425_46820 [Pseudomonas asuensis]|uniref:Uncharacterized protein n=1 Tax=Pseudomonas asuensis TaxID=1825787 RepID=A0ABQ2H362_9PSED|nr:hypothetical protein [Pseudomonas asuensis]GGM30795.1 hypothetical protein GCM10009425_46820 [Pseudomonas asuensis]